MRGARTLFSIGLLVVATVAQAQPAEIDVINRSGQTLLFLYISPSSSDSWGGDLLGSGVLADGGRMTVRLQTNAPPFDVRAIDENEDEYLIWGWEPGQGPLVIDRRASRADRTPSSADPEVLAWIDVVNDTSYIMERAYAQPAGEAFDQLSGLPDLLERRLPIRPGERYRLPVSVDLMGLPIDLLFFDEDGDRYLKPEIDLRTSTETRITLDDLDWM